VQIPYSQQRTGGLYATLSWTRCNFLANSDLSLILYVIFPKTANSDHMPPFHVTFAIKTRKPLSDEAFYLILHVKAIWLEHPLWGFEGEDLIHVCVFIFD
jgi:hypothetical protein